jgi:hypothetical protein
MSVAASEFYKAQLQRHYEARDAVLKLVAHWEREHEAKINGLHEEVKFELRTLMMGKARKAIARGGDHPVLALREAEFDEMMRCFISQKRRQAHGPAEHLPVAVVMAQRDALCAAYGWGWVDGPAQRVLPAKAGAKGQGGGA